MLVINEQKFFFESLNEQKFDSKCHKFVDRYENGVGFTKFSAKIPVKIALKIQATGMG